MRKVAGPRGKASAIRTARQQRRAMTLPEIVLWAVLKQRPGGLKFRRQHPLGEQLALDFYCNDARLAIEVDGEAHNRADRAGRDAGRDAVLAKFGIMTLRIPAADVLRDMDAVLRHILATTEARLPLHHRPAAGGPPPRDELGED